MNNISQDVAKNATKKAQTLQKGVKAAQKIIQSQGQTQPAGSGISKESEQQQWQLDSVASQQVAQNGRAFINAQQTQPVLSASKWAVHFQQQRLKKMEEQMKEQNLWLAKFTRLWQLKFETLSAQQEEQIQQKIAQNKKDEQDIRDIILKLIPDEKDKEEVKQKLQQRVELEKQISDMVLPLLPKNKRLIAEQERTSLEIQIYEEIREILEILPVNQRKKIAVRMLDEGIKRHQFQKDIVKTASKETIIRRAAEPLAKDGRIREIKQQTAEILFNSLTEEEQRVLKEKLTLQFNYDLKDIQRYIKERAKNEQEKAGYPKGEGLLPPRKLDEDEQEAPFTLRTLMLGLNQMRLEKSFYFAIDYENNIVNIQGMQDELRERTSGKLSQDQQQAIQHQFIDFDSEFMACSIWNQREF